MRYKKFGKTGLDVSVIGMGTWVIGGDHWGKVNDEDSIAAIQAMTDNGVNLIDTAPGYNWGHSEKIVGKAIKDIRSKVLISTKGGITPPSFGRDSSREYLMGDLERSLKNLQTDCVDFYFIHWPDENTPFEVTMKALEDMKKGGKIRFAGVSNFTRQQMEEASRYGIIDVMQPPYSMVDRSSEALIRWAAGQGIATMTYASMGAGVLSGAYRKIPDFTPDDYRVSFYPYFKEPMFGKILKLLSVMDTIGAKYDATPGQVAINWSTQKDFVSAALVGVRSAKHAQEDCKGMGWQLAADEIALLDAKIAEYLD